MISRSHSPVVLLPLLASLSLPAAGCYSDVESFAFASAKQYCRRLEECNRGAFVDRYDGDMDRCRDDAEGNLLDEADRLELIGWEYDPDAGRECVQAQRDLRKDCSNEADQDIARVCDDVLWDGF